MHENGSMEPAELLATLTDLRENRRISSEIAATIDPLRERKFTLELEFVSSTRTFGNRLGAEYDNGHTAICKTMEGNLEVSVMFSPVDNSTIESRSSGDIFEAQVTLLDFDGLYQRGILGHFIEEATTLQKEPSEEKFAGENPLLEDQIEEDEEIPEVREETRTERTDPWGVPSHSQATPSRKNWTVALAAGGFFAMCLATTQWEPLEGVTGWAIESDTLNGVAGWVLWAFLTYLLGLGLPCLANRSWISLSFACAAFVFDLTGTFLDYGTGGFAMDWAVAGEPVGEGAFTETDEVVMTENSDVMFYNVAMSLHALSILGLSISLAKKTGALWCLVMALLFAGYTYLVIQPASSGFGESMALSVNPSLPNLVAIGFCCWAIIRHERKLLTQESRESEVMQA